jgi:hypothetical protein
MKKQQSSSEKLPPPVVIAGQADAHMTRVFGVRQPQNFFSTKK